LNGNGLCFRAFALPAEEAVEDGSGKDVKDRFDPPPPERREVPKEDLFAVVLF
jgi:hypothetical protein